jgi:very-short-patch-repair endonuclease
MSITAETEAPSKTEGTSALVENLLREARDRLIDKGTRNRLVHVSNTGQRKPRGKVLNVFNERSDDVFRILFDGTKMSFSGIEADENEQDESETPLLGVISEEVSEDRYTDSNLETALTPDQLQKKLISLHRDAKTSEEEQGVNVLYLALGFLRWREDKASAVDRFAPLILLPVDLVRNKRTATYDLKLRDEDMGTNLPLRERLAEDFGITLPEVEAEDGFYPTNYFAAVREAISSKPDWAVEGDTIQLGFFSFAKFLMMRDLDPANWPDGSLAALDVIDRLLTSRGFDAEPDLFGETSLDEALEPTDLIQVTEADASQTKVAEEVRAGRHLVVQGPPGTGKSQTITNILAAAVHDGKTVLFVAEKMAALSVVHDRMEACGLGGACLELHSRAANKKAVLAQLEQTLTRSRAVPEAELDTNQLKTVRDRLNSSASALHTPLADGRPKPFTLIGHQTMAEGSATLPPRSLNPALANLPYREAADIGVALRRLASLLALHGSLEKHPLFGVGDVDLTPPERLALGTELSSSASEVEAVSERATRIASLLGGAPPASLSEIGILAEAVARTRGVPFSSRNLAEAVLQLEKPQRARRLCALTAEAAEAGNQARVVFKESALTRDLSDVSTALNAGRRSFIRRLFGAYKDASAQLADLLVEDLPRSAADRVTLVRRLTAYQGLRSQLETEAEYGKRAFGEAWSGEDTNVDLLGRMLDWSDGVGSEPDEAPALATLACDDTLDGFPARVAKLREALASVSKKLAFDWETADGASAESLPLPTLASRLGRLASGLDGFQEWQDCRALEAAARSCAPELTREVTAGRVASADAEERFIYEWAAASWKEARASSDALRSVAPGRQRADAEVFATLDSSLKASVRQRVRAAHLGRLPGVGDEGFNALSGELRKKTKLLPIRKLIERAGPAVQKAKPVFMMSPISVAQYLPPGSMRFDLLVIDEASQVRPEDALGAIARCEQIVVVGDQKQLPPTSFFDRLTHNEVDEDDDEAMDGAVKATDTESILALCEARNVAPRMLEWHYRSRDPSLIAVSNDEFYQGRLVLPPSPLQDDPDYGLSLTRVDGVYDRGGRRTNKIEGKAVVDAVAEHARRSPDQSLGIVTFSSAQSNLIEELLEHERRSDPALDAFLREGGEEDLFVKNIENVQGDERDVIFVSVGYGPELAGQPLRSQSFGPVNAEGGGRRLNVLFTRSRLRCRVFCSFDPGDIRTDGKNEGPRILKRYLQFALDGVLAEKAATGAGFDSPFEADVAREIERLGYKVDPQVGTAGFLIDLGVRHPKHEGRYMLAVEADGATYHSGLWTRERDRLRQEVLEHLGWRFHRIWSTDWFETRSQEVERLRAALAEAEAAEALSVRGSRVPRAPDSQTDEGVGIEPTRDVEQRPLASVWNVAPYTIAAPPARSGEPHEAPADVVDQVVREVVEVEAPVHIEEVGRRLASAFGKNRTGRRIQDAAQAAVRRITADGRFVIEDEEFVTTTERKNDPVVRSRASADAPAKAHLLPPSELRAAVAQAIAIEPLASEEEVIVHVRDMLGFKRAGQDIKAAISNVIAAPNNDVAAE